MRHNQHLYQHYYPAERIPLEDAESTHTYKGISFAVDFYPNNTGDPRRGTGVWQCSDQGHIIRERADSKQTAIELAHKSWDEYNQKSR